METIEFGHGVPPMSRLIYGVWRLAGDHDQSLSHVVEKVEACLDQGITTFDHADIYGDYECEAIFGRALHGHTSLKQKMQIVTKCDIMLMSPGKFPRRRVKHYDTSAAHIRDSVDNSLARIGVDVIDMLLIHRPDPLMDHHETGAALDALGEGRTVLIHSRDPETVRGADRVLWFEDGRLMRQRAGRPAQVRVAYLRMDEDLLLSAGGRDGQPLQVRPRSVGRAGGRGRPGRVRDAAAPGHPRGRRAGCPRRARRPAGGRGS